MNAELAMVRRGLRRATQGVRWESVLLILRDVFRSDKILLREFASVPRRYANFFADVENVFGELSMVCGVVAIKQSLIPSSHDKAGDVHGSQDRNAHFAC
jgi:hypothetical protein